MGIVVDFVTRTLCRPATPEEILTARIAAARTKVYNAIRTAAAPRSLERIAEAQSRAERLVRAGLPMDDAVRRAVAWAMCSTDPNPPNAPAPIAA